MYTVLVRLRYRHYEYARSLLGSPLLNGGKISLSPKISSVKSSPFLLSSNIPNSFSSLISLRSVFISFPFFQYSIKLNKMGKNKRARVSKEDDEKDREIGKEKSLYEILGVERTSSQKEIKKAYYKLALRLHPDKNPGDEEAKEKFQLLQKVISILGDEEKRALYDQTGCVDDEALSGEAAENLQEFFRAMYKKVTEADIEEFEANYRGSDSEKNDLKELYTKFKGNMNRLFCSMLCSEPKLDSHRFKDIIDEAIAEGELKTTKAYQKWAKQVSEMKPPTDPLVRRPKLKKQEETDLVAAITLRRSERKEKFDSIISSVVAKCKGEATSEPTEEEFEKARERLEGSRKKQTKRQKR